MDVLNKNIHAANGKIIYFKQFWKFKNLLILI